MVKTLGRTWEDEVREAAVKARQEDLNELLEERFGQLPDELVRQIEATTDLERLRRCIRQVLQIQSLDQFKL